MRQNISYFKQPLITAMEFQKCNISTETEGVCVCVCVSKDVARTHPLLD